MANIPYKATVEDLTNHTRRTLNALVNERNATSDASLVASIEREMRAVQSALDTLAEVCS